MAYDNKSIKLKVAEAIQDDVNRGIVRVDSKFMHEIGIRPGDVVSIQGTNKTVGIVDRAYPGDIGLSIIRMDGITRRNAGTGIGEVVTITKTEVKEAKKIKIAPAKKGLTVKAPIELFKQGLLGKAVIKGDIISMGGSKRRKPQFPNPLIDEFLSMMDEDMVPGFGFSELKFIVIDTTPQEAVVITDITEIVYLAEATELKEDKIMEVAYEDVGGLDEELEKIREMVELPLKHPKIFLTLGIEPPKGVLLHGPPGTGKTLLAKAVANETNASFSLINGPEIMSKFYGESEANLRKKFEDAEKNAPSIIFIDEIDAIATAREESKGEVERRVVAQLLALMDGLTSRGKVIVIAATNIPNALDPALRRPGRFDREIEIGVPSKKGRETILKIHTRNMPLIASEIYPDILENKFILNIGVIFDKYTAETEKLTNENAALLDERTQLQAELITLKNEQKRADSSLMFTIINKMKNLESRVEKINDIIQKNQQTQEQNKKKIAEANLVKEKMTKDAQLVKDSIKELKRIYDSKITFEDPRFNIVENIKNEKIKTLITQLQNLGMNFKDLERQVLMDKEAIKIDIQQIAEITHGFVGADLSALVKEAAMSKLRQVIPELKSLPEEAEIPKETLEKLVVSKKEFLEAIRVVRPSALREVLIEKPKVNWEDVGGLDEVKQDLKEAVEWPLKNAIAFARLGIKPPKGILLYGPPGTGKTLLAKAVANESEANFILVKGPELLSKWVGESEKAVRKIFQKARQTSPTIIFFDEIDSLAPRRGMQQDSHVTETVVNQLLTEMDGVEELHNVIIIAATNRPDIMDPALLRPGRFDRIILVPSPDQETKLKILKVHTKSTALAKDVNLNEIAVKMDGFVGADIEALVREAAILALREDIKATEVKKRHFEEALKKVGPSVTKEIEDSYKELKDKFKQARAKEMKEDRPSYYG